MKSKSNAEQEKRKKQGRQERIRADRGMLSRTGVILILCGIVAFLPVVGMLTNLMVFRHDEYSEKALNNQTRTTTVTASRGSIYDRNMNVMAVSTSVENVFLDPKELHDNQVDLNLVANTLGEILNLDPAWIQEQASDITMRYKMLATKQPNEVTSKIRDFIVENDIIGIHLGGGDFCFGVGGQLCRQGIALGLGAAGNAQLGKNIADLAALGDGYTGHAAAADNKNFAHDGTPLCFI